MVKADASKLRCRSGWNRVSKRGDSGIGPRGREMLPTLPREDEGKDQSTDSTPQENSKR